MWRFALALLPVLVACSGGDGDSAAIDPCVFDAPTPSQTSVAAPMPFTTVEDAQRRVDYDLKVPSAIPAGVELRSVAIEEVETCPGGSPVWLAYEGAGYSLTLRQTPYYTPGFGPMPANAVPTAPRAGSVAYSEPNIGGPYMHVAWLQDGVGIAATATLNDTLTEARFFEILESIE